MLDLLCQKSCLLRMLERDEKLRKKILVYYGSHQNPLSRQKKIFKIQYLFLRRTRRGRDRACSGFSVPAGTCLSLAEAD
jgi:hypothetical protein